MALQHYKFVVDERPLCVWGHDLRAQNIGYVDRLDPEYFQYLASTHEAALDGEHKQRAALALRLSYGHALETFFALACATVQAPECVPAWVTAYQTRELKSLVGKIRRGDEYLNRFSLSDRSWRGVASVVFSNLEEEVPGVRAELAEKFGVLWDRFSDDFLSGHFSDEHNSIKHGLRVGAGGFYFARGPEHVPGVTPKPEEFQSLGGSDFGSTFLVPERINVAGRPVWLKHQMLNWTPQDHARGLGMLGISIANVRTFLKLNTKASKHEEYAWPAEDSAYGAPWKRVLGVTSMCFNATIDVRDVVPFTDAQIRAEYARPDVRP